MDVNAAAVLVVLVKPQALEYGRALKALDD